MTIPEMQAYRPATLELVPKARSLWHSTATREDVQRAVRRYVRTDFSPRSTAGTIAISETRLAVKRRRGGVTEEEFDLMAASWVEIMDAARNGKIREAVTAKPERPVVLSSEQTNLGWVPLHHVAPRELTAPVVKVRPSRGGSSGAGSKRDWHTQMSAMLAKIPALDKSLLIEAAELTDRLIELSNQLEDVSRDVERLRRGRLRREAEERRNVLSEQERTLGGELESKLRSKDPSYTGALDRLLAVCTETHQIETEVFGWQRTSWLAA